MITAQITTTIDITIAVNGMRPATNLLSRGSVSSCSVVEAVLIGEWLGEENEV